MGRLILHHDSCGFEEQVRLLLDCGADANTKNGAGELAYDSICYLGGHSKEYDGMLAMLWGRMTIASRMERAPAASGG